MVKVIVACHAWEVVNEGLHNFFFIIKAIYVNNEIMIRIFFNALRKINYFFLSNISR